MRESDQHFLYININNLKIRNTRLIQSEYVSFSWEENLYFSNSYNTSLINNFAIPINHSLILPITTVEFLFKNILLQVWQNHMILYEHEVDISELNTRKATRKKYEIRQGQILDFQISLLTTKQMQIFTIPNNYLLQHFLIIQNIKCNDKILDNGPSYYKIEYSEGEIILPVVNSIVTIPLSTKIRFYHIRNGKTYSKSVLYSTQSIDNTEFKAEMIVKQDHGYDLDVTVRWASYISKDNQQKYSLLQAYDILLSDISIKFQPKNDVKVDLRPDLVNGLKLKVTTGNKAFQLNGDLNPLKPTRFARLIYFVVKSDEEDFSVILQKGPRIVAKSIIGTDQLVSYYPNVIKRNLLDPYSGKAVASIHFRCQKAKNLSLPQNNSFWKNCYQNKVQALMLQFSQISTFQAPVVCGVVIRSQQQQIIVQNIPDFTHFKLQTEFAPPVAISIRQVGNVYLKLISLQVQKGKDNALGMAVINPKDLRFGVVPLNVVFYKQKQYVCQARMIVNKVMPWPFIKNVNQPQSLIGTGVKTMNLCVMLKSIELTSYYWSYVYENKGDLFCIVQLNRIKKVLILERVTATEKLFFVNSTGSDILNYVVDYQESFKVKFTLLATDGGFEEQIYGTVQKRIKLQQLNDGPLRLKNQTFANVCNIGVGQVQFQIQKGLVGQFKRMPVKKELNIVKQDLQKINKSIERVQRNIGGDRKRLIKQVQGKKRYESLVLPQIKDPKQERLNRLAKLLQARQAKKRSPKTDRKSLLTESQIALDRRPDRVQSQGLNAFQTERNELAMDKRPMPLTVREEIESQPQKKSQVKLDVPSNQLQQNQFAQQIQLINRQGDERNERDDFML